jgi:hypothetical protein
MAPNYSLTGLPKCQKFVLRMSSRRNVQELCTLGGGQGSWMLFHNSSTGAWTETGYLGFTPNPSAGAIGLANDGTVSILGEAGNVNVSHDKTSTWSEPSHSGLTIASVANGGRLNSFILTTGGVVYHLNTILPQLTQTYANYKRTMRLGLPEWE